MEADGYPMNDEGPHALLTGATPADIVENLHWSMSRFAGYAGVTGALDGMRGERFAASEEQIRKTQDEIYARGLFYVDPRPGANLPVNSRLRGVDLVVDEPPVRSAIAAKLDQVEQLARARGQALALAGMPWPVTVAQLAAWANQLEAHGFVLVPVSALLAPALLAPVTAASR
jgi:polysaccharide deacetylase 2 family uncharacterized protein YibQ